MLPGRRPFAAAKDGFTLLEVLVALALLSIALVVILQLFSANLRGIAVSEDFTKASMKAESAMREILDDDELAEKSWSETTSDGYKIDAEITTVENETDILSSSFIFGPLSCRRDNRGFTLLELMISIAMLGLIVVIVAAAMRLGIRSVEKGENRINALERIRTSLNTIDSQIQSMIPLTYDDNGEKKPYFSADAGALRFATNYSIWGGEQGYTVVTYTVENDTTGKKTMKASESTVGMSNSRETTLLGSYDNIYFEYFYKGPTDEEGSWTETWTDDANMPQKMKLHLVSGQRDFSMIIPIRTAPPAGTTTAVPAFGPATEGGR
jgi:prepilin-type N-terminal cleavage/methylation domain-containing protein